MANSLKRKRRLPNSQDALKEDVTPSSNLTTPHTDIHLVDVTHPHAQNQKLLTLWLIALIGPAAALWVWNSALSFVPVPWPDDSAFYFVAKDLFKWPPRWVMLPQAPFEPTYRIWNFNTMPLYPILLGLGRLIGIDGSHALKAWPLAFWALSSSFLGAALYKARLPAFLAALVALALAMDPELRWGSVLVRPESLIGLAGIVLVTGLSLGWFTKEDYEHSFWDPISALLAIGAYAHFNAVHLLFAVLPVLIYRPRRLVDVALKTTIYLAPWIFTVVLKPALFVQQMTLQWQRLAVPNSWLSSASSAIRSLFQALGAPNDWPIVLYASAIGIWALILIAAGIFIKAIIRYFVQAYKLGRFPRAAEGPSPDEISLVPAAGWVMGTAWLWHNKPEVWFVYYIHLAVWTFAGIALLKLWKSWTQSNYQNTARQLLPLSALTAVMAAATYIFIYTNQTQAEDFGKTQTWNWDAYHEFVSCIDNTLTQYAERKRSFAPFQVWAPTFPDVTIELSRHHPDWNLSRTNDFYSRTRLALQHGMDVDAMVVTETLNWQERNIDAPWSQHPEVHSVWMDWKGYYLNQFMTMPGWKPIRHLCQKGRWQAFIFMK
jgi:hypothetical protein